MSHSRGRNNHLVNTSLQTALFLAIKYCHLDINIHWGSLLCGTPCCMLAAFLLNKSSIKMGLLFTVHTDFCYPTLHVHVHFFEYSGFGGVGGGSPTLKHEPKYCPNWNLDGPKVCHEGGCTHCQMQTGLRSTLYHTITGTLSSNGRSRENGEIFAYSVEKWGMR